MSFSYGGWASFDGVSFQSEKYTVHAKRKNGDIKITFKEIQKRNKMFYKVDQILSKIPFVRGLWLLVYAIINQWRMLITMIPFGLLIMYLVSNYFGSNQSNASIISTDVISLIIFIFIMKVSIIGKYHAAEHMTSNSYENIHRLDIETITKQSRIHSRCGTNLFVYIVACFILIFIFSRSYFLSFFLSVSIAYEIFRIRDKYLKVFLFPFYWIGRICQYIFFTSKPRRRHIEVGRAALKKLIELEKEV